MSELTVKNNTIIAVNFNARLCESEDIFIALSIVGTNSYLKDPLKCLEMCTFVQSVGLFSTETVS